MKKRWIAVGTAAGIVLLSTGVVFAVRQTSQERVKVISVQEMMGWGGGMNDMSLSGNIASNVSQDVYLGNNQVVEDVFVEEGDVVKEGDPLVAYDMTLVNLEMEMKKLDKEGIELNIKKAQRELTKLKNTKPSSGNGDIFDPGIIDGPGMVEEPEEPEEEPVAAYEELNAESEPYMGEGTVENPYHFLCSQNGVIKGSFLNRMAQEQCFFVIELREGDISNGELLKIWGQKIPDADLNLESDAAYELNLKEVVGEEIVADTTVYDILDGEKIQSYCKGDGSAEKPYTYLISADGIVKGSFFNQMKQKTGYFRLEVWKDNTYGTALVKAWEQDAAALSAEIGDTDEYVVHLGKKEVETGEETENPDQTGDGNTEGETEEGDSGTGTGEGTDPSENENSSVETGQPGGGESSVENGQPEESNQSDNHNGDTPAETAPAPQSMPETDDLHVNTISGKPTASSAVFNRAVTPKVQKTVSSVMDSVGDGMSKEELQKQIKEIESEIRGYQLDLKEAELELKKIQKELKNQTIKSTLNGVVKTVQDPEHVSQEGKPLVQVVSSEGLYIKGSISETQLEKLKVGDRLSGYSYDTGVSFVAEVKDISPYPLEGNQYGNSTVYPFTAYIENADGLKNYSYAELTPMGEDGSVGNGNVTVEKPFVRTEDGQYYVMIDDGNGRLKKQVVQISRILYGSVYEISSGLNWNDKIAFPYGKNVAEGAKTEDGTLQDLYS